MNEKKSNYEGYLLFLLLYKGSKSERYAPVLICENKKTYLLYKEGDNPLMYNELRPYHFSYCRVEAVDEGKDILRVLHIEKTDDPLKKMWDNMVSDADDEKSGND